jgi:hypothetical protein
VSFPAIVGSPSIGSVGDVSLQPINKITANAKKMNLLLSSNRTNSQFDAKVNLYH